MTSSNSESKKLLAAIGDGDRNAEEIFFSLVYKTLRTLAHAAMRKERPGHMLDTTALVNETYIQLLPRGNLKCRDRAQFYQMAGRTMRRILIGEARKKMAVKRGGDQRQWSIEQLVNANLEFADSNNDRDDVEALQRALEKLERHEVLKWMYTIIDLRFFVGLTFDEISAVLGVSKGKVVRDWNFTKAWLCQELNK